MGIKPTTGDHVVIPPDNTQSRWGDWEAELDDKGEVAGEVITETWALANSANERADLLDPIMDFGQSYMPTGLNFKGTGKLPFRNQRGPARGVRIENDGIRLLGEGAWQINCDIRASWIALATNSIRAEIRCYRPDGSLYTYHQHLSTYEWEHNLSFGADFVVPGPDYFVTVHISKAASGREFFGGWAITRLVAKRWSSQFINPPTGGAADAGSG